MAISILLNRTLVLPHLWSGSDRSTMAFHGIFPGSQITTLPRQMPSDIILDIEW